MTWTLISEYAAVQPVPGAGIFPGGSGERVHRDARRLARTTDAGAHWIELPLPR